MNSNRSDKVIAEVLGEEIAITPSELVSRTIKKQAVGGYDTNEVDDLLEHAAEALEKLVSRVRELKAVNEEQRAYLNEYREIESSLRNALVSSQKFGDDVVANAKREAELIVAEAKLHRSEAQAEAARLPETITREIRMLMEERDRIREDILAVLDAHRHWVEQRVPERDSALSERLLAFVNSRQGVALSEATTAAHESTNGETHEDAEASDEAEALHDDDEEHALPDVVLGIEPETETEAAPEEEAEAAAEPDDARNSTQNDAVGGTLDRAVDDELEGEVLEAVAEEDDETEVREPTT